MLHEDAPAGEWPTERWAVGAMRRIHPRFCAYVGEPPLRDLVRRGREAAARLGLGTDAGSALVTGMMFTLGHGFADDPLLPWVRAALRDPSVTSPGARVSRLRAEAERSLARALQLHEPR